MPNRNNYLSLELPDDIKQHLKETQDLIAEHINDDEHPENFNPMAFDALHMTICFLGSQLRHLKRGKKEELNDVIHKIVSKYGPIRLTDPEVVLFPPKKMNLFVVKYKCDAKGHEMVAELRHTIEELGYQIGIGWLPHITLGKVRKPRHLNVEMGDMWFDTDVVLMSGVPEKGMRKRWKMGK